MLRYLILGLLRGGPARRGYALMKEYRQQSGIEISIGNIYRELQRLAAGGLVRAAANPPGADPRRVPYEITPAGSAAFAEWLSTPTAGPVTECGGAFAFRALFLGQEDPAVGRRLITRWHDDLTIRRNAIQRKSESLRMSPAARTLLTRRLRHIAADLDFVGELSSAYEDWAATSKTTSPRSPSRRGAPTRSDVQPDASRPLRRSPSPRTG